MTFAYLWVAAPHPPPAPLTGPAKEEERTQSVSHGTRLAQRRRKRDVLPASHPAQPSAQPRHGVPARTAAGRPSRRTRTRGSRPGGGRPRNSCAALRRSPAALPDGGSARARLPSGGRNAAPQPARCRLSALLQRSGAAFELRPGGRRRGCRTRAPRSDASRTTASPRSPRRLLCSAARLCSPSLPSSFCAHLPTSRYLSEGGPRRRGDARSSTCRRSGSDPAGRTDRWPWTTWPTAAASCRRRDVIEKRRAAPRGTHARGPAPERRAAPPAPGRLLPIAGFGVGGPTPSRGSASPVRISDKQGTRRNATAEAAKNFRYGPVVEVPISTRRGPAVSRKRRKRTAQGPSPTEEMYAASPPAEPDKFTLRWKNHRRHI